MAAYIKSIRICSDNGMSIHFSPFELSLEHVGLKVWISWALICAGSILFEFKFPCYINLNVHPLKMWVPYYKFVSFANLNSNYIQPVPLKQSINSNFEADVLESEATAGKKESRLVISIFKLTTARSGNKSLT